jgi:hypothetical protein
MKKLLVIIFCCMAQAGFSQTQELVGDLIKIWKRNGQPAELQLMNSTKTITGGFLKNTGSGMTSFALLTPGDIPSLDWSKITTGKPTTLAGYGITDATLQNILTNGNSASTDITLLGGATLNFGDGTYNGLLTPPSFSADWTWLLPDNGGTFIVDGASYPNPSWLASLAWAKITGTPTTLSGYGITDGLTGAGLTTNYIPYWNGSALANSILQQGSGLATIGGHFIFGTDNTHDIGASGATRPRTGYFGTSIKTPLVNAPTGNLSVTSTGGQVIITSATGTGQPVIVNSVQFYSTGTQFSTPIVFPSDNTYDIGATGATRARDFHLARNAIIGGYINVTGNHYFGALTSSYPMLKRSAITVQFRKADDSGWGDAEAGNITSNATVTTLAFSTAVNTLSSSTTISATHHTIQATAASGNITLTLPPAGNVIGKIYVIKRIDATGNTLTVAGDGSETIDGAASFTISSQWAGKTVQSTGIGWLIISTF